MKFRHLFFFFDAFSAGLNILQIDKVLQNRCALDLGWICDSGVDVFERCLITYTLLLVLRKL